MMGERKMENCSIFDVIQAVEGGGQQRALFTTADEEAKTTWSLPLLPSHP